MTFTLRPNAKGFFSMYKMVTSEVVASVDVPGEILPPLEYLASMIHQAAYPSI